MEVVVPAMLPVLNPLANIVVSKLQAALDKEYEMIDGLAGDIRSMKTELRMIASETEDKLSQNIIASAVQISSLQEMRDWAHEMQDCLDFFLPCGECHRKLRSFTSPLQFAEEIKRLKKSLEEAHKRRKDYHVNDGHQAAAGSQENTGGTGTVVGIEKSKQELLELLKSDINGQANQLKVIPIVGFGGSGKTTLAKAVYDCLCNQGEHCLCTEPAAFPCHAWVEARKHKDDTKGLLSAVLDGLRPAGSQATEAQSDLGQHEAIKKYMNIHRCLIVFDDIDQQQWDCIKYAFPEKAESRIIVTTTSQQVAKACSSHGNGYVYNMRALDAKESMDLLETVLRGNSPGLNSTLIVDKCDGHPLALVSVANFLAGETLAKKEDCEIFCRNLGRHMEEKLVFTKLRQVLMRDFISLPGDLPRTFLQYMSVFPNGHPIRRNSLIRRWSAEGYVHSQYPRSDQEIADENFQELINRNVIRPIDASNKRKVKRCRTHGIMYEFMLRMSMSNKFITSLCDPERSSFCHLFLQNSAVGSTSSMIQHTSSVNEKLRARSLTICGNAGDAVAWFKKCELLRVLDLEECKDVEDSHIKDIHRLWHLKYLSLGGTIKMLPGRIDRLHCLETIDLKKTSVETMPIEIIRLPHLVHLLGKIKINKPRFRLRKLRSYLSKQSNLQTLAGIVVDENSAFPQLMAHMKMLMKVKIWCDSTAQGIKTWKHLLMAVNKFIMDGIDTVSEFRSLSLYLGNSLANFLDSLQDLVLKDPSQLNLPGHLTSLKLHGELSQLPQFVTSLSGLTELCLSSRNLSANELSNLHKLRQLNYLKLVQDDIRGFIIKKGHFPELIDLCLVVGNPNLPTIEEGASPKLVSLQLLCQALDGLSGINIGWLKRLEEVALDCKVNPDTIETWENEAKKHPKRPKVLFLERIDPNDEDSMVKYVASERPAARTGSSASQQQTHAAAPTPTSSTGETTTGLNRSLPGPSTASIEISSVA